jgi:hypothetical protein
LITEFDKPIYNVFVFFNEVSYKPFLLA